MEFGADAGNILGKPALAFHPLDRSEVVGPHGLAGLACLLGAVLIVVTGRKQELVMIGVE